MRSQEGQPQAGAPAWPALAPPHHPQSSVSCCASGKKTAAQLALYRALPLRQSQHPPSWLRGGESGIWSAATRRRPPQQGHRGVLAEDLWAGICRGICGGICLLATREAQHMTCTARDAQPGAISGMKPSGGQAGV